jgi:invasion protein IalB
LFHVIEWITPTSFRRHGPNKVGHFRASSLLEIAGWLRYVAPSIRIRILNWITHLRNFSLLLAAAFAFTIFFAENGHAAPQKLAGYGDWEVFSLTAKQSKICYAASRPEAVEPTGVRRGSVYMLVTHKPGEKVRNEVSVYVGYPLVEGSDVEARIDGGAKYVLFTHERSAWAPDAQTDKAISDAMMAGSTLTISGTSVRGTKTTDTYSLKGFTAALAKMDGACPP